MKELEKKDVERFEAVIGLEIHVELNTKTKLFSGARNHFGDDPNTNITEVCLGLPGALPVLNKEAVKKAILFGCAIQGKVSHFSKFDRKSYFYPDSPRNFQITQYDEPIVLGGHIVAEVHGEEKTFAINRVHLEDDAGMLKHFSQFAGIDYNRAGVPLIEIVSEPCMRGPKEAAAYAQAIKAIIQFLNISDCNMEEGSLRFDVNISVREKGETTLRPKVEIKNMNSFSNMEVAIHFEILRQIKAYLSHPELPFEKIIPQSTYRFDPEKGETLLMRTKENADDYRYFPEPDLPPIVLSDEEIETIRKTLPELPLARKKRYMQDFQLAHDQAFLLTSDKAIADYFEEALLSSKNGKSLCNWISVEFSGRFKDTGKSLLTSGIPAREVAALVNAIDQGTINGKIAKDVADILTAHPEKTIETILNENPEFKPLNDTGLIQEIIDQVVKNNPQSIQDFRQGKDRAFGFLIGQVMKETKGKASPEIVNRLLKDALNKSV